MTIEDFEMVLKVGEHIGVEFKEAKGGAKDDTFETVCSFLNRFGGDIFLGVNDKGEVIGVPDGAVEPMVKNIIKVTNNKELLNPTFYVFSDVFKYKGKNVVRIHVPASSEVHRFKGICYDRVFESDVQVQSSDQIAEMFIRKRNVFTEKKPVPGLGMEHLRMDLMPMIRNLIHSRDSDHPWLKLTDEQLFSEAGILETDLLTGKKVFNSAAVLLLGRDDIIFNCFPAYKTDAIMRRVNVDRYDDRETVVCNLIEAYDRLVAFGGKHLNDKFYLDRDIRVSLRDKILREVIGNVLIHREYSSARPARFIIEKERIIVDNASKALKCGVINLDNLSPVSKNPIIAKFFKQIGRADELGSGTRNLYHYTRLYSNADPIIEEGDQFVTTIPLDDDYSAEKISDSWVNGRVKGVVKPNVTDSVTDNVTDVTGRVTDNLNDVQKALLDIVASGEKISQQTMAERLSVSRRTVIRNMAVLTDSGLIRRIGSDNDCHWEVIK